MSKILFEFITRDGYRNACAFDKDQENANLLANQFSVYSSMRRLVNNKNPLSNKWIYEMIAALSAVAQYVKGDEYIEGIFLAIYSLESFRDRKGSFNERVVSELVDEISIPILSYFDFYCNKNNISAYKKPVPMNSFWFLYAYDATRRSSIDYMFKSSGFNIIDCFGVEPIQIICNEQSGEIYRLIMSCKDIDFKEKIRTQIEDSEKIHYIQSCVTV